MSRHRLSPLLDPTSVALYGATDREGAIARLLLQTLQAGGFKGRIAAIDAGRGDALGVSRAASAADLDFVPDVALAAVPADMLAGVIDDCAARGTRFVVVHSTGFDGSTDAGRDAMAALLRHARGRGVRLVGPHCMALMRPGSGFDAGFWPGRVKPGRVALLSQSGAVVSALLDWAAPSGIGFSSVLSLGRALDLDFGELLDWYLFDHQTDSVLLYLEGVHDARGFMSSVRALSRVKPVVIMKAGHGDASGRAVGASHSDALTGNDRVFDAAIARAGAVRAKTTFQLLAAARLLALRKRPGGPRLAIVANGGGPGVIAADAVAASVLELATLSQETVAALDVAMPGHGSHRNPVNVLTDADAGRIEGALEAVLADAGVDVALALFVPQTVTTSDQAADAIVRAAAGQPKLVAAVLAGGASAAAGQRRLDEAGIPQFLSPENAVDALGLLQSFAINQQKLRQAPVAIDEGFEPDVAAAESMYRKVLAEGRTLLDEVESKTLLGCFGIEAPPSIVANDPKGAAAAASRLGFPVVLKVLSPDIVHKSDVGGVRINVQSAAAAHAAAEDILESVARIRPDARISGIVVQPMVRTRHQREVYLGMATDPMFGAVIAFGAGGVAVEQIDDVAIGLPPLNPLLARSLVSRTRVSRLLRPYRSVPGIDFPKLEQTLVRFSALVCECPWIASLDINPLVVDEGRVTALDARIEVKTPADMLKVHWRGAYGHLAIHPYPRELEETVTLKNGDTVLLRPIRPEDADREREFVARLSPQTLYRRFMMPVKELSDAMIERFTQIDYDRELALVALRNEDGGTPGGPGSRIVGVARIIPTWEDRTAEFAIVVGDWMQHSGLGRELMLRLFDAGRTRGYSVIEGIVLGENVSMLRFCERLGFRITLNPDDPAERIARKTLD
ncbi:MAG: bifunctional acetate--CoA ligase family protein/GNAT family N-acetyltransferase [Burkholderiales bacterium]|jgi:acetyltransferase